MMGDVVVETANALGRGWVAWVIPASLDAAALLAVVGLIWLGIRGRVAPQVGYGLFLLVPLKLLMPLGLAVPSSLAEWTPSAQASAWLEGPRTIGAMRAGSPISPVHGRATTSGGAPTVGGQPYARTLDRPATAIDSMELAEGPTPPHGPSTGVTDSLPGARKRDATRAIVRPRLSGRGMVVIAWLVIVVSLLGRLVRSQRRFDAGMRQVVALDEVRAGVDVGELCRLVGLSRTIPVVEAEGVAAPSVWGLVRPAILLPKGFAGSLTPGQLRWVLLHELAHIRRGDLWVVALQRLAGILHFFNPAVWVANRVVHQLREYACDDLAVSLNGDTTGIGSGEAFLRTLEYAERRGGLEGALGVFGLASRGECYDRVRRLLDSDRPIRIRPSLGSLAGLVLLAAVSLPRLHAAGGAQAEPPAADKPSSAGAGASVPATFELRVVGPDQKPVPEAHVEIRTTPLPEASDVLVGRFVAKRAYGSDIRSDGDGRVVIKRPKPRASLNASIITPGYGPYWAAWSAEQNSQEAPARFTAELEGGWSVGVVVVGPDGKPLEGVRVRPSLEYKKRPGDVRQFGMGSNDKTDAQGRWRFDSVPTSLGEVFVEVDYPEFKAVRRPLTRGEFGLAAGQGPSAKVALERGLSVTGKVTDESGKPIAGALIRTKFLNDRREAKTGEDGVYHLVGCEPVTTRIVVSAKGKALDMKELRVDPAMGPVDFAMKPGGTVRVRVLDSQGKAVPKARIFFQSWRGPIKYFEFDHVNDHADANGYWEWNEAPLDEFQADICPPEGMQMSKQPLVARPEEYVVRTPPLLVISGGVIDAKTKEPIKSFRVVPGIRYAEGRSSWSRGESFTGSDGHYRFTQRHDRFANLLRIEAEGYQARVSRDIKSNEGDVTVDFALERGRDIAAKVVTPQSGPAAGAKVALGIAGSQINIQNGDIDDGSTYASRLEANDAGFFQFPPQSSDFQLVITHPSGYAHIKSTPEWPVVRVIRLQPWSRVEGTFRVGRKALANIPLTINVASPHSYGPDVPSIFTSYEVTTGPDGKFVFERVVGGRGQIGRHIMLTVDDGAADVTSAVMVSADFPAGKTLHLDLGGKGRVVVGKLRPPQGFRAPVRWNFAMVSAQPLGPEGHEQGVYLWASVDREGNFRIDDVPEGKYSLDARFQRDNVGWLSNRRFEVNPAAPGAEPGPVDLGTLELDGF